MTHGRTAQVPRAARDLVARPAGVRGGARQGRRDRLAEVSLARHGRHQWGLLPRAPGHPLLHTHTRTPHTAMRFVASPRAVAVSPSQ